MNYVAQLPVLRVITFVLLVASQPVECMGTAEVGVGIQEWQLSRRRRTRGNLSLLLLLNVATNVAHYSIAYFVPGPSIYRVQSKKHPGSPDCQRDRPNGRTRDSSWQEALMDSHRY